MNLSSISSEFKMRHDFEDEDLNILYERWENQVVFKNIPVAWIIPIDEMLAKLKYNIKKKIHIYQEFGQLCIIFPSTFNITDKTDKIIKAAENKIKNIDKDLNDFLTVKELN